MEKDKSVQTTNKNFLTIYSPETLNRQLVEVRNINDVFDLIVKNPTEFPTLSRLKKEHGTQKVEAIIKLYLIELCELVNLKRPLTEKQIDAIALEVVSTYTALTIADIHVIFRKAKNGEFGEFYDSLDMPKVMKWFQSYFDERCEAGAERSIRESEKNYDKGENMTSERMREQLNKLEKKFRKTKR